MAGVSDKMGFTDPGEAPASSRRPPGSKMGMPTAAPRAPAQLNASEQIGIAPAPGGQAADHGGPRLPHFNLGANEGLPGMGGDAAGGEAAAGGAAEGAAGIGELAPLALLA
jgi:hypothetical protein